MLWDRPSACSWVSEVSAVLLSRGQVADGRVGRQLVVSGVATAPGLQKCPSRMALHPRGVAKVAVRRPPVGPARPPAAPPRAACHMGSCAAPCWTAQLAAQVTNAHLNAFCSIASLSGPHWLPSRGLLHSIAQQPKQQMPT